MIRVCGLTAVVVSVAVDVVVGSAAQAPALDTVLARLSGYVGEMLPRFANVVAVETYEQRTTGAARPVLSGGISAVTTQTDTVVWRLTSDFLLVAYQLAERDWIVFRDVAEVDGKRLDRPPDRLVALFTNPGLDAAQRAAVIARESMRHHLPGGSYAITNPLLVMALMQAHYQPRLRFTLGGEERVAGDRVRVVRFEERDGQTPLLGDVGRARGSVWLHPDTGRIVRTAARLGALPNTSTSQTTFAQDERLGLSVPVEMRTTWTYNRRPVNGVAKYGAFRRFGVQSETHFPQP